MRARPSGWRGNRWCLVQRRTSSYGWPAQPPLTMATGVGGEITDAVAPGVCSSRGRGSWWPRSWLFGRWASHLPPRRRREGRGQDGQGLAALRPGRALGGGSTLPGGTSWSGGSAAAGLYVGGTTVRGSAEVAGRLFVARRLHVVGKLYVDRRLAEMARRHVVAWRLYVAGRLHVVGRLHVAGKIYVPRRLAKMAEAPCGRAALHGQAVVVGWAATARLASRN